MDYQSYINCIEYPAAVLSVQKAPDGSCGTIHIVCANKLYKEAMGPAYYDGMPYYELVPQDVKFEDFCFRAAIGKQKMQAYVQTPALHTWTDMTLFPLAGGDENLGYLTFMFEFTTEPDASRMASVSLEAAQAVAGYCIRLLGSDDFQAGVYSALHELSDFAEAAQTRILLVDDQKEEVEEFGEAHNVKYDDRHHSHVALPYDLVRTWEPMVAGSNCVLVKDAHDMQRLALRNPQWVQSLQSYDIHSLALVPMRHRKKIIGYLYLINFNTDKLVEVKERIEMMAYILSTEIANHQLMRRLEWVSTLDDLTGIKNRNSMQETMRQLEEGEHLRTLGIVNMDLNELKKVNDTLGHVAGDNVIVYAAEIVKEIYGTEELYRPGGDEFLVIMKGKSKEVFDRKLQALMERRERDPQFNIAIGHSWTVEGERELAEAFLIADRGMYQDKKEYYQRFPEKDRRLNKT